MVSNHSSYKSILSSLFSTKPIRSLIIFLLIFIIIFSPIISIALDDTNTIELTKEQKEKLKNNLFIPIIGLYKKIVIDKQIEGLIRNISINVEVGNKVPVGEEVQMIKNYLLSNIPGNNKVIAEKIWDKTKYLRTRILPGITTREYGWAKVNNPRNGYGNFQITAPNVCGQIINPNSIVLGLGKKVYFTPPQYCQGVYKLCTYQGKQNYTCTCGNIDFRANKAKLLDGKDGFSAKQWIEQYKNFCAGKSPDTNVFANLRYPFQYGDFIGFVYNKINGYQNGINIIYNMRDGYARRRSVAQLIKKVYGKDYKKYFDAIFNSYLQYVRQKNIVLTDLSDPSLNFPVTIDGKQYDYQQVLISIANDLKLSPDILGNLLNSYQLGIIYSKYNGLGNAGYNFFDNSYVSNVNKNGGKQLGLNVYYIFGKITKDYCTTCIGKDMQTYGAMIFANIYQKKTAFLQYLLLDLFPKMVQKGLFKKLVEYKLF